MKDRIPRYPGRVKLTPVPGQADTYDMVRMDDPTQAGDPLNKNTFLKDTTAALFQLDSTAVPDDVFQVIAQKMGKRRYQSRTFEALMGLTSVQTQTETEA